MTSSSVAQHTLRHQGRDRTYVTVAPDDLQPGAPVLLYFHGSGQSANVSRRFTANTFDRLAETTGTLVVYPEGVERHFNDARAELAESARTLNIDDVGFTRALLEQLVQDFGVDHKRVFAVGYSNGGQMVIRLLHDAPEMVAGAATIAAPVPVAENLLDSSREADVLPRRVLVMHGTGDPIVPYRGGTAGVPSTGKRGRVRSAPESAQYFAERNGITAKPFKRVHVPGVEVTTWSETHRHPVELWCLYGVGHVVPAPKELPPSVGATTTAIVAAEVIADFFELG